MHCRRRHVRRLLHRWDMRMHWLLNDRRLRRTHRLLRSRWRGMRWLSRRWFLRRLGLPWRSLFVILLLLRNDNRTIAP
jgi:hypothetical protein